MAGFRIDVCNMMIKDAELRDNPPATEDDPFIMQMFGQRPVYNGNRPEAHDILRRWRTIADRLRPGEGAVGRDERRHPGEPGPLLRVGRRRAAHGVQLPLHRGPLRGRARWRASWPAPSPCSRRRRGRCGRARTTTCRASPPGGVGATRPRCAWPCSCSSPCGARPCSTRATRSGSPTGNSTRTSCSTRSGLRFWPVLPGPRPRAHAHAVGRRAQRRVHRGGGDAVAPDGRRTRERGRPARRDRLGAAFRARRHRAAAPHTGPARRRLPGRACRRRACGCGGGAQPSWRSTSRPTAHALAVDPTARHDGGAVDAPGRRGTGRGRHGASSAPGRASWSPVER